MSKSPAIHRRLLREVSTLASSSEVKLYFHYESLGFKNDDPNESFLIYGHILPQTFPYNYGSFKIQIKLPDGYPFIAPELSFLTHMYHRNVHVCGDDLIAFCCHHCAFRSPATPICKIIEQVVKIIDDPVHPCEYRGYNEKAEEPHKQNSDEYWKTAINEIENMLIIEKFH
jgi:ubiquitin-protein ligase